ncbi:hypothetical protein JGH11_09975 [Dysgonomonas sp. Marseille-P4677]|nr:hypothetical protein [Dysgonomonas sp. Marseille-P4677]
MNAQDGLKGTWFTGGALTINSDKSYASGEKEKTDAYTVMPLVGTFISPSVAVGGALGYTHVKNDGSKTNNFTIMPLARKYWNISGGLYFFGQAALPIGFGSTKVGEFKTNNFGAHVQLAPGFDLIVNSWFTVEASFVLVDAGYSSQKPKGGETSSSWGINGNSISSSEFGELSVGVKFLF